MKTFIYAFSIAACALAFAGAARAQDSVAGKWHGEFDSQVGHQSYTYDFKVDGTNLTGNAFGIRDNGTNDVAITEGSISTNGISFVEPLKFDDNDVRIEYTGKVNGDEIKFHRQVGDFGSEDFTAKRVKTATITSGIERAPTADTNSPPAKP
jgi:hypothetical protein